MTRSIVLMLLVLVLVGCTSPSLSVRTEYFNRESLASYYMSTPDPLLDHPPVGQRLIVNWSVPKSSLECSNLHLHLIIRLADHSEIVKTSPIQQLFGTYVFEIEGDTYLQSKGILTYKAEIRTDDCILDQWQHPLWAELITFSQ